MTKLVLVFVLAAMGSNFTMAGEEETTKQKVSITAEELEELSEMVGEQSLALENESLVKIFSPEGRLVSEFTYQYGDVTNDPRFGVMSQELDFLMESDSVLYFVTKD
jgi:hypothetical protein